MEVCITTEHLKKYKNLKNWKYTVYEHIHQKIPKIIILINSLLNESMGWARLVNHPVYSVCIVCMYIYIYIEQRCRHRRPPGGRIPFITGPFSTNIYCYTCGPRVASGGGRATEVLGRGVQWKDSSVPTNRTHRVKIPSSTLPRAVVKDVICLMRFDINRLPRCIYIYYTFMCMRIEHNIKTSLTF